MSDGLLEIFCVVHPDTEPTSFLVTIENFMDKTVYHLKAAIKAMKSPILNHVAADQLTLWPVMIPDNRDLEKSLKNTNLGDESKTKLFGTQKLDECFPDKQLLLARHIHVLGRVPPPHYIDYSTAIISKAEIGAFSACSSTFSIH